VTTGDNVYPDLPYAKSLPGLRLLFLDANRVEVHHGALAVTVVAEDDPVLGRAVIRR
jgi:hypothetical protein